MIGGGSLFLLCVSSVKIMEKSKIKESFEHTHGGRRRRAVKGCVHVRAGDVGGSPQKYILTEMQRGEEGGGAGALAGHT